MTSALTKRLARAVLIAGLALPVTSLLPANTPFAATQAHAEATTLAEFKTVLAQYGTFAQHDKYGEIWVPGVTPAGWHPYQPCHWSYTKDGWYFNDQTAWGQIVHHYGRWSHDEQIGWFWVPGEDWSPGWVAWRQSDRWIGWVPLPPEQDAQLVNTVAFNNDKDWIFMETSKFRNGECDGDVTVQPADAFYQTNLTTLFDLPHGLLVDVVYVPHWTVKVITELLIVEKVCPPSTQPVPVPVNPRPPTPQPNNPNLLKPQRTLLDSPIHFSRSPSLAPQTPMIELPRHPGGRVGRTTTSSKPSFVRTLHPIGQRSTAFVHTGATFAMHGRVFGKGFVR
jgi:hypothetical protein